MQRPSCYSYMEHLHRLAVSFLLAVNSSMLEGPCPTSPVLLSLGHEEQVMTFYPGGLHHVLVDKLFLSDPTFNSVSYVFACESTHKAQAYLRSGAFAAGVEQRYEPAGGSSRARYLKCFSIDKKKRLGFR